MREVMRESILEYGERMWGIYFLLKALKKYAPKNTNGKKKMKLMIELSELTLDLEAQNLVSALPKKERERLVSYTLKHLSENLIST